MLENGKGVRGRVKGFSHWQTVTGKGERILVWNTLAQNIRVVTVVPAYIWYYRSWEEFALPIRPRLALRRTIVRDEGYSANPKCQ